jgi:hypothetical protein
VTKPRRAAALLLTITFAAAAHAIPDTRTFDIGNPTLRPFWVDPVNGNDNNDGSTRIAAFKTIDAAWNVASSAAASGTGVEIILRPGDYPAGIEINQLASYTSPIVLRAEVTDTARLHGIIFLGGRNVYVIGVTLSGISNNFSIQAGFVDYLLLRDVHVIGSQGIYVQLSTHVYLENVHVEDSTANSIEIDRDQYGHVNGSRVARSAGACFSETEGSAYLTIDGNDFGPCAQGAIWLGLLGQLDRFRKPWIQYDSYDVKVVNNVIHDYGTSPAVTISGAYNMLFAHNTVVAPANSTFIRVVQSVRVCSQPSDCQTLRDAGGWGPVVSGVDAPIPNRNVSIFGNIFYTRTSVGQSIFLNPAPAATPDPATNIPSPSRSDDNLLIRGNVVWSNGLQLMPSSGAGCDNSNPTCNAAQLTADNRINMIQPQFVDAANGNYRPLANGNLFGLPAVTIPPFTWSDLPSTVPIGELDNTVARDADGLPRTIFVPGAFTLSAPLLRHRAIAPR